MSQRKMKKGVQDMTDGIGKIGSGNYGWVGFGPQRQGEDVAENPTAQPPVNNYDETQVDPSKVMDFLAAHNFFVAPVETNAAGKVDEATRARVEGYMEQFEMIYGIVAEEFGERLAPDVMDYVMDYLMGMAA